MLPEWNQDMPDESGMPDEFVSRSLSESPDFDMDAEPLLRGLLERDDLRRGVKADLEVALADVERLRLERDSARKLYLSAGEARDKAEAEVDRLTRAVESEATHGATLETEIKQLHEVIRRMLFTSGPITPETPCRCGATQPAHYCDYEVEARRDALAMLPEEGEDDER